MSKGFTNSIIGGAGEGLYVWKKYSVTSGTKGDFLSYITSDSILSYPLDGQKGDYWYELVKANIDCGEITLTNNQESVTINHSLGEAPLWAGIFPNENATNTYPTFQSTIGCLLINNGTSFITLGGQGNNTSTASSGAVTTTQITFPQYPSGYPYYASGNGFGTYRWFVVGTGNFLESLSWQQIGDLVLKAEQGTVNLSDYFSVGDTKPVTLTTGETIELQIAGFNHDTFSDGVTAPVTFVMKDCLNTKAQMNSTAINAGGYPASAMKTYVETNIYDKLPSDLKTLVAPVKKKWYTTYNDANSLTESNYNVWLLSEMEVSGTNTYTIGNGEGTKYDVFTDNASRIKRVNGTADWWWLGSCGRGGSDYFVCVRFDGVVSFGSASSLQGVCAGLCIRGGQDEIVLHDSISGNDKVYNYIEGMTWGQWIDSAYSNNEYIVDSSGYIATSGSGIVKRISITTGSSYTKVLSSDLINPKVYKYVLG